MVGLRRSRAAAQLLHRPGKRSAPEVVHHLLAVQAQDLAAARLALRARCDGLAAADVDAALTRERSLVVAWLGRGTLHLVGPSDYAWLLGLTAPARLANSARRLAQEGVPPRDADRALATIERALSDRGPLTRGQLAERIAATGIRTAGQATPHLLGLAALRGVALKGPIHDGEQAFALTRDWLGSAPPTELAGTERELALAELARRYLTGHGPATPADLASWAGLGLRDARAGLGTIASELVELGGVRVDLARRDKPPERIPPRLLPAFDPYLLGWTDRGFAVPPEHAKRIHPGGGMIRATATVDGLAVGTWRVRRGSGRTKVELDPLGDRGYVNGAGLEDELADVVRFEAVAERQG